MTSPLKTLPSSDALLATSTNPISLPVRVPGLSPVRRFLRALRSNLEMLVLYAAVFLGNLLRQFRTPERHEHGLVLVLPGIEGESFLNHNIVRGLADAGVPAALRIFDWTTRFVGFFLIHLRSTRLHKKAIGKLTQQIIDYRREYPEKPIYLIGHSGGAAIAALTVQQLPEECQVDGVILLAAALSPGFNFAPALRHVKRGLWSFHSHWDFIFLSIGTIACGTLDGRWTTSGGKVGFHVPDDASAEDKKLYAERLHQIPFCREMRESYNFGSHLSCTNRVFIAEWVAPLIDIPR